MRHLPAALIVLLIAFAPGCGGDEPVTEDTDDTKDTSEGVDSSSTLDGTTIDYSFDDVEKFWKEAEEVQLTEEMMEEFFRIGEELNAIGDDKVRALAVMSKYHGWSIARWQQIAAKFGMATLGTAYADAEVEMRKSVEKTESKIAEQKEKLATAQGPERAVLEQTIAQLEQSLEYQKKQLEVMPAAKVIAGKNRAILEKYKDRWREFISNSGK